MSTEKRQVCTATKVAGKLGYMSILEQLSVYATQSGSTAFPVPTDQGAIMTYPSVNLTTAVISEITRAYKENIRIWKE